MSNHPDITCEVCDGEYPDRINYVGEHLVCERCLDGMETLINAAIQRARLRRLQRSLEREVAARRS